MHQSDARILHTIKDSIFLMNINWFKKQNILSSWVNQSMPLFSVYGNPIQYIQLKTKLKSTSAATLSGTMPTGEKKKNHYQLKKKNQKNKSL